MRYLSPTQLSLWLEDKEAYYKKYFTSLPRSGQTPAMAVGSAFDAVVKNAIDQKLGYNHPDYRLKTLFEKQVEAPLREEALTAASNVWVAYKDALAGLFVDVLKAVGKVCFEFEIKDVVDGVPLLGKPDLYWQTPDGGMVLFDWKVNGYYSQASPAKYYVKIYPGGGCHPEARIVNGVHQGCLSEVNVGWARQLATYAWLLGEPVGSERWTAAVDQVVCRPSGIRVACHRCKVSQAFQEKLFVQYHEMYRRIEKGLFFDDMTVEECAARGEQLKIGEDDLC